MKYLTNKVWLTIFRLSPPESSIKVVKVEKFGRRYLLLEAVETQWEPDFMPLFGIYDTQIHKIIPPRFFASTRYFKQDLINEVNKYIEAHEQIFPDSPHRKSRKRKVTLQ